MSLESDKHAATNQSGTSLAPHSSFSLLRVAYAVGLGVLVIVSLVVWLKRNIIVGATHNRTAAQESTFRRGKNLFDFTNSTVPQKEILSGGPPVDGIPSLSDPEMVAAKSATYLSLTDRVIGIVLDDQPRAYPLRILNYHEIINDRVDNLPIAISYCPLCDSASVFNRNTSDGVREFGVSGFLYNSNVLMYDRSDKQKSLWSQIQSRAISGPQVSCPLSLLPLELTTWSDWQSRHPTTTVLSADTGHDRDYSHSPYARYFSTPDLMFPASPTSDRLPNKEKVLGVRSGGKFRSYPYSAFSEQQPHIEEQFDGKRLVLEFNSKANSLRIVEAGDGIEWMYSFWFSWFAMHPETELYEPLVRK